MKPFHFQGFLRLFNLIFDVKRDVGVEKGLLAASPQVSRLYSASLRLTKSDDDPGCRDALCPYSVNPHWVVPKFSIQTLPPILPLVSGSGKGENGGQL
jgi:hypothetical protein